MPELLFASHFLGSPRPPHSPKPNLRVLGTGELLTGTNSASELLARKHLPQSN